MRFLACNDSHPKSHPQGSWSRLRGTPGARTSSSSGATRSTLPASNTNDTEHSLNPDVQASWSRLRGTLGARTSCALGATRSTLWTCSRWTTPPWSTSCAASPRWALSLPPALQRLTTNTASPLAASVNADTCAAHIQTRLPACMRGAPRCTRPCRFPVEAVNAAAASPFRVILVVRTSGPRDVSCRCVQSGKKLEDVRAMLGRFGLSGHHHLQPILKLSGAAYLLEIGDSGNVLPTQQLPHCGRPQGCPIQGGCSAAALQACRERRQRAAAGSAPSLSCVLEVVPSTVPCNPALQYG